MIALSKASKGLVKKQEPEPLIARVAAPYMHLGAKVVGAKAVAAKVVAATTHIHPG